MSNSSENPTSWMGITIGGGVVRLVFSQPRHGNALPEHITRRIVELDEEGLPRCVIRERLGVGKNQVTKYLRLAGRRIHRRGPKPRGICSP